MVIRKLAALGVAVSALMVAGCGTQEGNAAAGEGEGGVLKRSPPQLVIFRLGAAAHERSDPKAGSWRPDCRPPAASALS